jgi:uncharacterized membrane protein YdbT with pleckstrin-like domain
MSNYIQKTLIQDEKIIQSGQISIWPFIPFTLMAILFTFIHILSLLILIPIFFLYKGIDLGFTNKRIITKTGIIGRNTTELDITKFQTLALKQTIPGRIFNYGTIEITGYGNPKVSVPYIKDPLEFRRKLLEYVETI